MQIDLDISLGGHAAHFRARIARLSVNFLTIVLLHDGVYPFHGTVIFAYLDSVIFLRQLLCVITNFNSPVSSILEPPVFAALIKGVLSGAVCKCRTGLHLKRMHLSSMIGFVSTSPLGMESLIVYCSPWIRILPLWMVLQLSILLDAPTTGGCYSCC